MNSASAGRMERDDIDPEAINVGLPDLLLLRLLEEHGDTRFDLYEDS